MLLLPFENLYLITSLKPNEVDMRLKAETEVIKSLQFGYKFTGLSSYFFLGNVNAGKFEIMSVVQGRNSFIPFIKGTIEDDNVGSRIHLKMRMHLIVNIIMAVLLGFFGKEIMQIIMHDIKDHNYQNTDIMPFIVFLFLYILCISSYNSESKKVKNKLMEIFEADIDPNA